MRANQAPTRWRAVRSRTAIANAPSSRMPRPAPPRRRYVHPADAMASDRPRTRRHRLEHLVRHALAHRQAQRFRFLVSDGGIVGPDLLVASFAASTLAASVSMRLVSKPAAIAATWAMTSRPTSAAIGVRSSTSASCIMSFNLSLLPAERLPRNRTRLLHQSSNGIRPAAGARTAYQATPWRDRRNAPASASPRARMPGTICMMNRRTATRVLDERATGFTDFSSNRQYLGVGKRMTDKQASPLFVDYPNESPARAVRPRPDRRVRIPDPALVPRDAGLPGTGRARRRHHGRGLRLERPAALHRAP